MPSRDARSASTAGGQLRALLWKNILIKKRRRKELANEILYVHPASHPRLHAAGCVRYRDSNIALPRSLGLSVCAEDLYVPATQDRPSAMPADCSGRGWFLIRHPRGRPASLVPGIRFL